MFRVITERIRNNRRTESTWGSSALGYEKYTVDNYII
jgi:hypothetical protein